MSLSVTKLSCSLVFYLVLLGNVFCFTKGIGVYTLTSRVIPHEVRRQGLDQENPCPGDRVEFTCTRSESSPSALRWIADETSLYTFFIPYDINTANANQSRISGLIGFLVNETILTLKVDLNTSTVVTNNTVVTCRDSSILSHSIKLVIIGQVTVSTVRIQAVDSTTLVVIISVRNHGNICVNQYKVSIDGLQQSPSSSLSQTIIVNDPSRKFYTYYFTVDICKDVLQIAFINTVAITNGVEGANTSVDVGDVFTSHTLIRQTFNSTGFLNYFPLKSIDSEFLQTLNVSCSFVETFEQVSCTKTQRDGLIDNQAVIFIPYNGNLTKMSDIRVAYSSQTCEVLEVEIKVQTLNSTSIQVRQNNEQFIISFSVNEILLEVSPDKVLFSSNCTDSVTSFDYTNPVLIILNDSQLKTGQCQYSIRLVDNNSKQIGLAITGVFSVSASPKNLSSSISQVTALIIATMSAFTLGVVSAITILGLYKLARKKITKSQNSVTEPQAAKNAITAIYDEVDMKQKVINLNENISYGQITRSQ